MERAVRILVLLLMLGVFSARAEQSQSIRLSAAAKRTLVERALTLKKGDAYSKVIDQLGKPTIDQKIGSGPGRFVVRSLKFYVVKSAGVHNEQLDEHIDVYLDMRDRVKAVYIKVEVE